MGGESAEKVGEDGMGWDGVHAVGCSGVAGWVGWGGRGGVSVFTIMVENWT